MAASLRDTLRAVEYRKSQRQSVAMAFCSTCGNPKTARTRIDELENEVRVLMEQSVDALTRLADYEEEIRRLKARAGASTNAATPATAAAPPTPIATPIESAQHSYNTSVDSAVSSSTGGGGGGYGINFASFRMGRKPSTTVSSTQSVDPGDLQSQLAKEQAARQEAEKKAEKLNGELEDLSQNLFEQANEMVATERKARSKLEERVALLEKRDKDKSRRLELLEGAMSRLERVRTLLAPPSPPY